ncbi:MAG: hypothetical protein JWR90_422 [Marmoricola sp.]|jgi:hypothetical protein|nr:hypothetical protein [Marmoricola sp.]
MMLTPLRRRLAAFAVVLLVPALGGCGIAGFAGEDYQTDQVYQPAVGTNVRSGEVDILGAAVVSGIDGSGTFIASLVNKSLKTPAQLTSVTGPTGVTVQLVKPVDVAPDTLVNLADEGAVSVTGPSVKAGGWVKLTLKFDTGQSTSVNTTIVDRDLQFSQVPPAISSTAP